jgi:hypothetical protein
MKKSIKIISVLAITPLLLNAVNVPSASSKPTQNLQNYLQFQLDSKISFTCKHSASSYICQSKNQEFSQKDEETTSTIKFKEAVFTFNTSLKPQLQKDTFSKTMREISQTQKQDDEDEIETPLADMLDRAVFENLKHVDIKKLDVKNTEPKSHIKVKSIVYDNGMKKSANGVSFEERILGDIKISYKEAYIDTNDSVPMYQLIAQNIEEMFETNNVKRSEYVSQKLNSIYEKQLNLPADGEMTISTNYLKGDILSLSIKAQNTKAKMSSDSLNFKGEIHNASSIFKPAKKALSATMPDFLFQSLKLHTYNNADNYRKLIKEDKKFAKYIGEYNQLITEYFDKETKAFTNNTILKSWLNQAKNTFSKVLLAKADRVDISIKNRGGATAMQFFGMMMGKLMMPPKKGAKAQTQEEVIADIATENIEFMIEAK